MCVLEASWAELLFTTFRNKKILSLVIVNLRSFVEFHTQLTVIVFLSRSEIFHAKDWILKVLILSIFGKSLMILMMRLTEIIVKGPSLSTGNIITVS
jgi:hypothetical protein